MSENPAKKKLYKRDRILDKARRGMVDFSDANLYNSNLQPGNLSDELLQEFVDDICPPCAGDPCLGFARQGRNAPTKIKSINPQNH
jgi:hypothetical protein